MNNRQEPSVEVIRRMNHTMRLVIAAASLRTPGVQHATPLRCWRAVGGGQCSGRLVVSRTEVPPDAHWECPRCGYGGTMAGSMGGEWDLRRLPPLAEPGKPRHELHPLELTEFDALVDTLLAQPVADETFRIVLRACGSDRYTNLTIIGQERELLEEALDIALLDPQVKHRRVLEKLYHRLSVEGLKAYKPFAGTRQRRQQPASAAGERWYRLRITLDHVQPPVWRELHVPGHCSLATLHRIIQAAFDWSDTHLHEFVLPGQRMSPTGDADERMEKKMTLAAVAPREKMKFQYIYDFGDHWQHTITVKKITVTRPGDKPELFCFAGAGSCPPEDCGGPPGYMQLLAAREQDGPEGEEAREWLGDFVPEYFEVMDCDHALAEIIIRPARGG